MKKKQRNVIHHIKNGEEENQQNPLESWKKRFTKTTVNGETVESEQYHFIVDTKSVWNVLFQIFFTRKKKREDMKFLFVDKKRQKQKKNQTNFAGTFILIRESSVGFLLNHHSNLAGRFFTNFRIISNNSESFRTF